MRQSLACLTLDCKAQHMNQLTGRASLREQIGGKGYFADVSVNAEVESAEKSTLVIAFSDTVAAEWREAAAVGLRIGWRCLPSKHKHAKQASVSITSIDTQPGDTSEVVVIYVAAKALLSLFNAAPANAPVFVAEFGIFLFAK
jgi:hypothetical protein